MNLLSGLSQTLRSLRANRVYNLINILGLALGLASTFILIKIMLFEWNTDKFHKHYDEIRYATIRATPLAEQEIFCPHTFFDFDNQDYPEINVGTKISFHRTAELKVGDNIHKTPLIAIDSVFHLVFDFPLQQGEYDNLVKNQNGIILTKSLSRRLFSTENSLGETVAYLGKKFTVVGILDELPGNSSLKIEGMVSIKAQAFWSNGSVAFARFNANTNLAAFNEKIIHAGKDHSQFSESILEYKAFSELYFGNDAYEQTLFFQHGNSQSLRILLLIACLLFIVSTFNYLNIYQVTLQKRAKTIGVLCIHGAGRSYLGQLFLKENIITISASAIIVVLIYSLLSPYIPVFFGKSLPNYPINDILLLIAIAVLLILISSGITSLRFRKLNSLLYIKELYTGKRAMYSRQVSMTIQYIVTMTLIIVSLFFIKQLNFMMDADMGFKTSNIISIPFFVEPEMDWGIRDEKAKMEAYELFKEKQKVQVSNQQFVIDEINKNPFLTHLCFGRSPLNQHTAPWKNVDSEQPYIDVSSNAVTPNFKELYGIEMSEGRFFERGKDQSRGASIVINEAAKQQFGIEDITKSRIANRYWGAEKRPFTIIGVMKDYSFDHLSKETQAFIMYFHDDKVDNDLMLEIAAGKEEESLEFLRNLYEKVNPGKIFTYHFVEDDVEQLYVEDKKLVRIYGLFTIIALIISSLGLFSFSIYDVQQRFKEIGIRKANGSGIWETVLFLTKNVFILLGIAFLIAVPVAWIGILKYLEDFAHKAPISWWIFVLAALFTLVISVLTVITQSYRAASRNPVDALRYE